MAGAAHRTLEPLEPLGSQISDICGTIAAVRPCSAMAASPKLVHSADKLKHSAVRMNDSAASMELGAAAP